MNSMVIGTSWSRLREPVSVTGSISSFHNSPKTLQVNVRVHGRYVKCQQWKTAVGGSLVV